MSQSAAIQELARQVRQGTIELLRGARPEWLTWTPRGTSNHLLWHAGHALWVQDVLGLELLTGRSELPQGWSETFGMDCRPVKDTTDWPAREQLLEMLATQLDQIFLALSGADDQRLGQVVTESGATLASRILHGLHDEAKHQGEMCLLIKMCRAAG
jgi:hypothetical protein